MKRLMIYISLPVLCAALCGCGLFRPRPESEENLRRRAAEFCDAWRGGDLEKAYSLCSHNFRTSMDRVLFEHFMKEMPIDDYGQMEIAPHMNLKDVRIEVKRTGGDEYTQLTYWRFERGNWFLDLVEWR